MPEDVEQKYSDEKLGESRAVLLLQPEGRAH